MLLSRNTFLVDHGPDKRPAVHIMPPDDVRLFYAGLELAEACYGAESLPVRAVLVRYFGASARRFFHLYDAGRAHAVADNEAMPGNLRAFAAALLLGVPLPGSDGASGPSDDGGRKARLVPEPPRKPPGGVAVNPSPVNPPASHAARAARGVAAGFGGLPL